MYPPNIQQTLETADTSAERALTENKLPGLGVGIVYQGELIYAKGFGLANVAQKTPVTPDTVFRIASVSKTFAAVALMQLWEQGQLDLYAPANQYLKGYQLQAKGGQPITPHHLLTHTAGLGELTALSRYFHPRAHFNVVRPTSPVPTLRDLYGRFLPAERPAGEKWCYANNGFATVGQLVEDISDQLFRDYMRQHIFDPLGMDSSDFWRSPRLRDRLAVGYSWKQNLFKPVFDLEQITLAAGSMNASINDMGRYMAALMSGGQGGNGRILQAATLEKMFTPQYQLHPYLQGMGYGFKIDNWEGHRVVSHDGLWLGFISALFVAPDDELGVVALTNTASSAAISLARQLLYRLLGVTDRPLKKSTADKLPDSPETWPDLTGYYSPTPGWNTNFRLWQQYGNEFEVYQAGQELMLRSLWGGWKKGFRLNRADEENPLIFKAGGRYIVFRAGELLMGLYRLEKRPYAQSLRRQFDRLHLSRLFK